MNIIPKFQHGGSYDSFYNVYTPLVDKSEQTTSSSSSSSSKKSKSGDDDDTKGKLTEKDLYSMIKENLDGLPNEMAAIVSKMSRTLQRAKLSGIDDLNDISTMYLSQLHLLKQAEYNKERYKDARQQAIQNGSLNDILITPSGELMTLNTDTQKIEYLSPTEWQKVKSSGKYTPITGGNALWFRANHPDFTNDSRIFTTIENSIGIDRVIQEVQKLVQGLGKDESTSEFFYTKQGQNIAQGAEILQSILKEGPDGVYKIKEMSENQQRQVKLALNYVYDSLPQNAQNRLKFASNSKDIAQGVNDILLNIIGARTSSRHDITASFDTSATKVAGTTGSDELNDGSEKTKYGQWFQIMKGEGGMDKSFTIIEGDTDYGMSVNGKYYSALPGVDKGAMTLQDFLNTTGAQHIVTSTRGITFGGAILNPQDFSKIMYQNTGGYSVTLPARYENGVKVVNLDFIDEYSDLVKELKDKGYDESSAEFNNKLGELLNEKGYGRMTTADGLPNPEMFQKFLVLEGYSTEEDDTINKFYEERKKNKQMDTIQSINPKSDKELTEQIITTLGYKDLDKPFWFTGDYQIFKSRIYIPLNNNLLDAANADGTKLTAGRSHLMEGQYQEFNKRVSLQSTATPDSLKGYG